MAFCIWNVITPYQKDSSLRKINFLLQKVTHFTLEIKLNFSHSLTDNLSTAILSLKVIYQPTNKWLLCGDSFDFSSNQFSIVTWHFNFPYVIWKFLKYIVKLIEPKKKFLWLCYGYHGGHIKILTIRISEKLSEKIPVCSELSRKL